MSIPFSPIDFSPNSRVQEDSGTLLILVLILRKKSIFAIKLLSKFDFDHRMRKPEIFGPRTLETIRFWPSGGFARWFR
jgi:hypothetical protein